MKRKPAVAGRFYPDDPRELREMVDGFTPKDVNPIEAAGVISPHAGYVYSGAVAGKTFANIVVPKRCIVLGPNHTGHGKLAAIMSLGSWAMPTGEVPIDSKLAGKLIKSCNLIEEDAYAHIMEHSLEVQIPFMLRREPELSIVPICLSHINIKSCKIIGEAIATVISKEDDPILIVASSDMNHYESQKITEQKDHLAIDCVLKMEPENLLNICAGNNITMCGVIPAAVMLFACKKLKRTKAKLIAHQTSGDVSGDYNAVVGYAGIVVF